MLLHDQIISSLIDEVYNPTNLGVTCTSKSVLKKNYLIISEAINKKLIGIKAVDNKKHKPINLLPYLNIQRDYDDPDNKSVVGDDVISYLSQLNIFLTCAATPLSKKNISMHIPFPSYESEPSDVQLKASSISHLLDETKYSLLKDVNFFNWRKYDESYKKILLDYILGNKHYRYHFWFFVDELDELKILYKLHQKIYFDFIITPDDKYTIRFFLSRLEQDLPLSANLIFRIYVSSDDEYVFFQECFNCVKCKTYYMPLYNGGNLDFFEDKVYLDEKDIFSSIVSMQKIFCNQKINSNFFGVLYVYPNGSVTAKNNSKILGNLYSDSIKKIIHEELIMNTSWRKIRNNKKCNFCCYRFLCPPPSIYEDALNVENLCFIENANCRNNH